MRRPRLVRRRFCHVLFLLCVALPAYSVGCSDPSTFEETPNTGGSTGFDGSLWDRVNPDGDNLDVAVTDAHVNDKDALLFDGPLKDGDANSDADDTGTDGPLDGPDDAVDDVDNDGPFDAGDGGETPRPICYRGDFDTDGLQECACMMVPGPSRTVLDGPGLVGHSVSAAAVSPDGTLVAIAVRQGANSLVVVHIVRIDGGVVQSVINAPTVEQNVEQLSFSADGNWVAMLADFDLPGTQSLYAMPALGGTARRVSPQPQAGRNVTGFAWARKDSPNVRTLAFTGYLTTDETHGLWTVEVGTPSPAPTALLSDADLGADGDVQSDIAWSANASILFRANLGPNNAWALYRATADGSLIEPLPGTLLTNAQGKSMVGSFGVSPNGLSLAFSANSPQADLFEVYIVGLKAGSGPAILVSNTSVEAPLNGLSGPAFQTPIAWSHDGSALALVADWRLGAAEDDDVFGLFVLPTTSPAGGVRLLSATHSNDLNVREVRFADNGALIARGDLVQNGAFELFYLEDRTTQDQDPATVRFEQVPPGGDVLGLALGPN